jgi:glycosyltransferase involved in cell wall biosynthesis
VSATLHYEADSFREQRANMRILYVHQHFSSLQGSTGTRSYAFARRLVEHGHEVTVLAGSYKAGDTGLSGPFIDGRRQGMVDGINVVEFDMPVGNADGFLKRSMTFLAYGLRSTIFTLRGNWDVVFATSTPLTAALPGIAWKIFRRRPFVFEVRDLWPELPQAMGVITNPLVIGAMSALEWSAYRAADAAIGLAPGIVEGIQRRSRSDLEVAMIPNAADLDLFTPDGARLRPAGVKEGDFLAVFTGAHGRANGLDSALDAAAVLKQMGRDDIRLGFIGEGSEKNRLKARAESEKLDNCLFLDPVRKTELPALMRGANAGLMLLADVPAFYRGTSPNKFFDYCAAGLPVINNYGGWLAGMIETENCGVVAKPGDPKALASAIVTLADNRDFAREAGRRARLLAERDFDRDNLADQFVAFLENMEKRNRAA